MEDLKLRKKNLIMFPLGTVGRDMVYSLVTNFLLTYILFTRGLNAAQLAAVTAIMVGARVFDALNDPISFSTISPPSSSSLPQWVRSHSCLGTRAQPCSTSMSACSW